MATREELRRAKQKRLAVYKRCPKVDYIELSGRQTNVLHSQAARFGLPLDGRVIDLGRVLARFHDLIADLGNRAGIDDEDMVAIGSSPALEKYREEKAAIARYQRLQIEARLLPRDLVHTAFSRVALVLRQVGQRLNTEFGNGARSMLDEALDEACREVDSLLASVTIETGSDPPEGGDGKPAKDAKSKTSKRRAGSRRGAPANKGKSAR